MHSTEELKRQYEQAAEKSRLAEQQFREAKTRYLERVREDALKDYAAKGIVPGCTVVAIRETWLSGETMEFFGFIGVEDGWSIGTTKPVLSKLKKDGTPSMVKKYVSFDRIEAAPSDARLKSEVKRSDTTTAET